MNVSEKIRYRDLKDRRISTITIHNGRFHADDVFCAALCQIINPKIQIFRTRDLNEFKGLCCDVGGGRYDHLLEKFGKETPSIGFAIIVDELMNALSRQKISVDTIRRNIIVYNEETESNAIILAGNFREKGRCIELIRQKEGQDKSLYESYAKRKNAAALIYLCDDKKLEMTNLITGEKKTANIAE